jgi:P27 family predicted phage terminase small subunit
MAENIPTRPQRGRSAPLGPQLKEVEIPAAPAHLSDEARSMWDKIAAEWLLGPDALPLLRAALEQWDLYQTARREVAERGATVVNPDSGMVRQHPAVKTATDALREFRMCMRQLGLQPPEN